MALSVTETTTGEPHALGRRGTRLDAVAKVTGAARFAADIPVMRLLHARPVLSQLAHSRIRSIDCRAASAMPGVVRVLTAADLPIHGQGGSRALEPLARAEVIFAGQPVALVVAETEAAAEDAAEAVVVDYEPLDPVVDLEQAMHVASPLARVQGAAEKEDMSMHTEVTSSDRTDEVALELSANVIGSHRYAQADTSASFRECAAVAEGHFRTSWVHQSYMEPQAAVAWTEPDGRLVVQSSTQGHFFVRKLLSGVFGLPLAKVRVVSATLGGGFGGKIGLIEPLVAAASMAVRRPVRLVYTRSEDFAAANPAPACIIDLRVGARADGTLAALEARILVDAGAYPESGGAALAGGRIGGPYRWQSWNVDVHGILTNRFGAGAYRAPTAPQTAFAVESLLDELSQKLGIDPIELRLRNAAAEGDPRIDGVPWPPLGLAQVLEAASGHALWQHRAELPPHEGVGMAAGLFPGGRQGAGAMCRMEPDGSFVVSVGAVDMSGTSTGFAAIAAETLGVSVDRITVVTGDTDTAPPAVLSGGSMVTYSVGPAVHAAARQARDQLLRIAAEELEIDAQDLEIVEGFVRPIGAPARQVPVEQLASKTGGFGSPYAPVTGNGSSLPSELAPSACANIAHVRVDPDTGVAKVLELVSVQDVGHALNVALCEGQMRGGAAQGLGWALMEALVHDETGQLLTGSFLNYALPKSEDVPPIDTIVVEQPSREGPYGAKGIGESAVVPGAGAIANAIAAATGVRLRELPMTGQRLWQALAAAAANP